MREYFYYIDEKGKLYHDRTELTDVKFLNFFFRQLRPNPGRFRDKFPYISPCGPEMNYIRSESQPVIFHSFEEGFLTYQGGLREELKTDDVQLLNGQLLHPAGKHRIPGRAGSDLLIQFSEWIRTGPDNTYILSIPGCETITLFDER